MGISWCDVYNSFKIVSLRVIIFPSSNFRHFTVLLLKFLLSKFKKNFELFYAMLMPILSWSDNASIQPNL